MMSIFGKRHTDTQSSAKKYKVATRILFLSTFEKHYPKRRLSKGFTLSKRLRTNNFRSFKVNFSVKDELISFSRPCEVIIKV